MSFLNPTSLPVMRFSSTDASAPQINYNSRTAGDVKAVLKACLVTGYGAKASAGWSIANEVDHVCEFVSPSAAMSDYRLGVNDTSASSTTWYYTYKNARDNMRNNVPSRYIDEVNRSHADNGWQLLVTSKGFYFVELIQHIAVNKLAARLTYFGQIKSGLVGGEPLNMAFYNIGQSGVLLEAMYFYQNTGPYFNINGNKNLLPFSATPLPLGSTDLVFGVSNIDIVSAIYLTNSDRSFVVGELAGISSKILNNSDNLYGISEEILNNRPVLKICLGYSDNRASYANSRGRVMLLNLDYWEY